MTILWKATEQYFTVVLFVNPLTPRMKPWVIQSFLTLNSMDRTLKCYHSHWKAVERYFTVMLLAFKYSIYNDVKATVDITKYKYLQRENESSIGILSLSLLTMPSPKVVNFKLDRIGNFSFHGQNPKVYH